MKNNIFTKTLLIWPHDVICWDLEQLCNSLCGPFDKNVWQRLVQRKPFISKLGNIWGSNRSFFWLPRDAMEHADVFLSKKRNWKCLVNY